MARGMTPTCTACTSTERGRGHGQYFGLRFGFPPPSCGPKTLRGYMVSTVAGRLGVTLERAEEMAAAADVGGLVTRPALSP